MGAVFAPYLTVVYLTVNVNLFKQVNIMENPIAVANYFVQKSLADGTALTPMKVLKLTYISHGWYLALSANGNPLLNEAVQAWKYGPVIPSVYRAFKKYENGQILAHERDARTGTIPEITDGDVSAFLDKIWDVYKHYSGLQLSTLTHKDNTPWDTVWNKNDGKSRMSVVIPNDIIKEYYQRKNQGEVAHA
jgi:uncharacterized phage-associated protein